MTLSRKHYWAIAEILRNARYALECDPAATDAIYEIERGLSQYFKADNPAFDVGRFLTAAMPPIKPRFDAAQFVKEHTRK